MTATDTLSYAAFSASFQSRLSERRLPLNGTIEVTRRCPLTCLHCYNNLPMSDSRAHGRELDYDEHRRLLDELADAGCLWLLYTGGEIFARRGELEAEALAAGLRAAHHCDFPNTPVIVLESSDV